MAELLNGLFYLVGNLVFIALFILPVLFLLVIFGAYLIMDLVRYLGGRWSAF